MKVIVVGLGRMGSGLALQLSRKGHDVVAIDQEPQVFKRISAEFSGKMVQGVAFDHDVLEEAGISQADAVVCCTNSDEVNTLVARIAKNIYHVSRVVARLYDIRNAEIYKRLDIQTISTTSWGIERAMEIISYDRLDHVYEMGNGSVNLLRLVAPVSLLGSSVQSIEVEGEIQVVAISRDGMTFIPDHTTCLEVDDVLYLSVISSSNDKLKTLFDLH